MKTQHRKAAQHKRRWQKDYTAAFKLLEAVRPIEPGELDGEHIQLRFAYERLRDGTGNQADFDTLGQCLNAAMVRAEAIDDSLVQTVQLGLEAMVRMQGRQKRGLRLGFDAFGLRDVPAALDAWEAIADSSTPMEMRVAIKESFRRIRAREVLTA